ncbi:serine/threonine protein kinase [Actinomadura barringtoniae]|uniref:non-specific serine/threonine protein kinase n=2 Tax=Actinomadura barringtoniae TaxID=1427535 RepID=A0A939PC81_9ACTN|nr:serine/threonine protein kinase [Actinomadura barringtoniae]
MGTVWRALDLALEREVALKEVRLAGTDSADLDPATARMMHERVMREARALARVEHPNVVTIHHIVDSPELPHPWLVMELVRGQSLQDRLARGPLPPAEAAALGRGILGALRAVHAAGIQHRDVKPANVLLRSDGTPVLTDFGIAVLDDASRVTATGALVGSPEYIAPERLHGNEGDPASDLWSLGLLLYVAVEGNNPMRRPTAAATLAAVMSAQIPPPQRAGALGPVLQDLLVPNPAARPAPERLDQMLAHAERSSGPVAAPPGPPGAHGMGAPPPLPSSPSWPTQPPPSTHPSHMSGTYPPPPAPVRRSRPGLLVAAIAVPVVAVLAALVVLIGFVLPKVLDRSDDARAGTGGSNPTASRGAPRATTKAGSGTAVNGSTLLTPAAVRAVIKKLQDASKSKQFAELTIYEERANADAPVAGRRAAFDNYTYEKGADAAVRERPSIAITTGDAKVDPSRFNWDALPALLERAKRTLKVPKPTMRYVIVESAWAFNGDRPTMMIHFTDDYGGGYLAVNEKGKVISTYPSTS